MNKFWLKLLILLFGLAFLFGCTISKLGVSQPLDSNQTNQEANNQEVVSSTTPEQLENLEAKVPVLIYHHIRSATGKDKEADRQFIVSPQSFEKQMAYLKENNFETISFADLANYFEGKFIMPAKPVIISFDDGLINQYDNALPILNKYNLKATFFIFSNPIGRSSNYLDWDQVKELDSFGMEIGSHGYYHLYLDRIDNQALEREISESKKMIEENLGKEIDVFSYPFGTYNETVTEALVEAGYRVIRDIVNGVVHHKDDLLHLRAYFITENFSRFKNILNQ